MVGAGEGADEGDGGRRGGGGWGEGAAVDWTWNTGVSYSGGLQEGRGRDARCMRVLTMSSGWTIRVAMEPAESPATVSTRAGERPACLASVIETSGCSRYMSLCFSGCACFGREVLVLVFKVGWR